MAASSFFFCSRIEGLLHGMRELPFALLRNNSHRVVNTAVECRRGVHVVRTFS
jgi:hypothetical protein